MAISNYTEAQKERIRELSEEIGFDPNDPMFQIIDILGNFEEMMSQFPAQMEGLMSAGAVMMDKKLAQATSAAQTMQHAIITAAVKESIKQEIPQLRPIISLPLEAPQIGKVKLGIWSIGGILGGILAVGVLIGGATTQNVIANYVGDRNGITANDFKLLQWAKSEQGKQAQQLYIDNKTDLELCRRQSDRLLGRCVIRIRK